MPQILPYSDAVPAANPIRIFIKVEPRDQGGVLIVAVNEDGTRSPHSQLIAIDGEGYVHLKGNVNPDLGFPLAYDGTIEQN